MRIDRNGFTSGLIGLVVDSGIRPEHNSSLITARNTLSRPQGAIFKRGGTTLSIEASDELALFRYQYSESYSCQLIFTANGIIAAEYALGRFRQLGIPDQFWGKEDIKAVKTFESEGQFYVYIPRRWGVRPYGIFIVYENAPVGLGQGDDRFNPVKIAQRGFTRPPYVPTTPLRDVTISRTAPGYFQVLVHALVNEEHLLTAADVGRTIIMHRLMGQARDNPDDMRRLRWHELVITGVNGNVANCRGLSQDYDEYNYPERTNMWMISAFTNDYTGIGRLGSPDGFCVHEKRLWCYKGSWLMGSRLGVDLLNFEYSHLPDFSITVNCPESTILWLISDRMLIVGTPLGLHVVSSQAGARTGITISSIGTQKISEYGASKVKPIKLANGILFIANNGKSICRAAFSDNDFSVWPILSHLLEILGSATIIGGDSQFTPHRIIWLFLSDFRMVSITMSNSEPDMRICGVHELGGATDEMQPKVLSGLVSREENRDILVLHVRRFKEEEHGLTPLFNIEYLDVGNFTVEELEKCNYLDSKISLTYEEPLLQIQDGGRLWMRLRHADVMLEGFNMYVQEAGQLKILFRNVEGYAPPEQPSPIVDIVYAPLNLQYQNKDEQSFTVMYINSAYDSIEQRATPLSWQKYGWQNIFYPLLESSLKLKLMMNTIGVPGAPDAIVVEFEQTLTNEQCINQICPLIFQFHGIGNIFADGNPAGAFDNNVFTLYPYGGSIHGAPPSLLLADTSGLLINRPLVHMTGDVLSKIMTARVFIGSHMDVFDCDNSNIEGWLQVGKNLHKEYWTMDEPPLAKFRFEKVPNFPELDGQRIQLLPNKDYPPEAGMYYLRLYPHDWLYPVPVDGEPINEANDKLFFYQKIKFRPVGKSSISYDMRHVPELKQGYGNWHMPYIPKEEFKTLLGMNVVWSKNNRPVERNVTLSDNAFYTLPDGREVFLLSSVDPVFTITFGYPYVFEMMTTGAVVADPSIGSTEGMTTKAREAIIKVYVSAGGEYSASDDARDNKYQLPYNNTFDRTPQATYLKTGALRVNVERSVDLSFFAIRIVQISSANIAITNIVENLTFEGR